MSLEFRPPCVVPPADTHPGRLLRAMQRGGRYTILNAGPQLGIGALSQEIGRLKRDWGWEGLIKSRTIKTVSGSHIKEYWLGP